MSSINTNTATESLLEWWHVLVFAATMIIGYILGDAKQRWTQEQLGIKMTALEKRLDEIERSTDADSRTLGLLGNDLSHIRTALAEIKTKLGA
jgi:hypothetical protein